MEPEYPYAINPDVMFAGLQRVDVPALDAGVTHVWFNQALCRINDCEVCLGVFKGGTFHWHKHDEEDEFFFVLEGRFTIETEGESVTLTRHQGYLVPRGVLHRTSAPEPATVLMTGAASTAHARDDTWT